MAKKGWLEVKHGVERGVVLLREGVPLYEPEDLRPRSTCARLRGEHPKEPQWLDYAVLWELYGELPALCLRVRSNEMELAGLAADGSIIALARNLDAEGRVAPAEGDVVAARIGEDVVLRRIGRVDGTRLELRPESPNRKHRAMSIDTGDNHVEVIGVVIGRMLAGAG